MRRKFPRRVAEKGEICYNQIYTKLGECFVPVEAVTGTAPDFVRAAV